MTVRHLEGWFEIVQKEGDLKVARQLLAELEDDPRWHHPPDRQKIEHILNLITAIRLDQLSKLNFVVRAVDTHQCFVVHS